MTKSMPDQDVVPADMPRILVAEDEFLIRMLVSDHLREAGFSVVEAFNADEAMDILKSGALIDLIFTDVRMPGTTDGLGLVDFVNRVRPDLPVLVTSGHLEPDLAYAAGAIQFIPKPCNLDVVTLAIRAALERSE